MKDVFNRMLHNKHIVKVFAAIMAIVFTVAITAAFSSCNFQDEDATVLADNVFVFNPENIEDEIIACDDNSITVKTIYGLTEGAILNSGYSEKTPYGLLRKVSSIEKAEQGYKVNTQPAALNDAIKHCNLHYTAAYNQDGSYDIINRNENDDADTVVSAYVQKAYAGSLNYVKEWPFGDRIYSGKAGFAINFDCEIDVASRKCDIEITGEIYASAELNDLTRVQFEKEFFSYALPDVWLDVGIVINISQDIALNGSIDANLKSFKVKAGASFHKVVGFRYTLDTGITPILEDRSQKPYFEMYAEQDVFRGSLTGKLTLSYTAKLYHIAGFTVEVALVDELNAHLKKLSADENNNGCIHVPGLNWDLKGRLTNKVYIPISGKVVLQVEFDIFGGTFTILDLEKELFNTGDTFTLVDDSWEFGDLANDPDFNAENQIVLVLDISGSMSGKPLDQLKSACTQFINSMSQARVAISIVGFESKAEIYIEDSDDINALINTINSLKDKGSTNMDDGLQKAEGILNKGYSSKKSIVLMSDGEPNAGRTGSSLIAYAETLKNKGITIYTVGFFHSLSGSKSSEQQLMEDIASPGFHYEADTQGSLQAFFDQIATQIQGISYILIRIECPVDVTVSYNGETLSSVGTTTAARRSFGSLNFQDEKNSSDKAKILRLKEGPAYNISINGTGTGKMNYSIAYSNARNQYDDTRYFDNISVNSRTKINTGAELTDTNIMTVDENGDGNIVKYKASSNEHAKEFKDVVASNDQVDEYYEEEQSMGFFEWLFKTINRFFSDILSGIWFLLPIN